MIQGARIPEYALIILSACMCAPATSDWLCRDLGFRFHGQKSSVFEPVLYCGERTRNGVLQICVAGWSMGAIHACMVASLTRFPVATAAILPPRSASTAYCDGALSNFVDFAAMRSARDSQGVPVLETAANVFAQQPNYPNVPQLFEHFEKQAFESKTNSYIVPTHTAGTESHSHDSIAKQVRLRSCMAFCHHDRHYLQGWRQNA
jgi:hypothetical protein